MRPIVHYKMSPTAVDFHQTAAFMRGVMGPLGSGKSVMMVMELMRLAHTIHPCKDGVRRSRWVVIRASYPELKSTTIKTWLEWLGPKHGYPNVVYDVPIRWRYHWKHGKDERGNKTPDVDMEVLFLACDKIDDIAKLKSLDVTGFWINEVTEVSKAIFDMATSRAGRYPPKMDMPEGWPANRWPSFWGGIIDTNPPDDDHWYYKLAEEQKPRGYKFWKQPSGLARSAENIQNLPGGRNYYTQMMAGKKQSWIDVFVKGNYGSTADGRPVYPEYHDNFHRSTIPLEILRGVPVELGFDYGVTPACAAVQRSPSGQIRVLREYCTTDGTMGIREFTKQIIIPALNRDFDGMEIRAYGDPGALSSSQNDNLNAIAVQAEEGLIVQPARSNVQTARKDPLSNALNTLVHGHPGLILDPSIRMIRKGLNGHYRYKRMPVAFEDRYKDVPEKNEYSHPVEALEYVVMEMKGGQFRQQQARVLHRRRRGQTALDRAYGY